MPLSGLFHMVLIPFIGLAVVIIASGQKLIESLTKLKVVFHFHWSLKHA